MKKIIMTLVISVFLFGCFHTTIRSGEEAGRIPPAYDEKWHAGLINGIAELSGPYDLDNICENGWHKIKVHTSFLNGLVDLILYGLYSPQTVTIQCSVPDKTAMGDIKEYKIKYDRNTGEIKSIKPQI